MSNHTTSAWKKYTLHHRHIAEALRKEAADGAEQETEDNDATETGAGEAALSTPQPTSPRESPPLPLPPLNTPEPGPALAEIEAPKNYDQLDFEFAVDILTHWNRNEEADEDLWERMERTVRSSVLSWDLKDD